MRRDTYIGDNRIDHRLVELCQHGLKLAKGPTTRNETVSKAGQSALALGERVGVPVKTDNATLCALQQGLGVSASPKRTVYIGLSVSRIYSVDQLL
jgi:hypothetical protein